MTVAGIVCIVAGVVSLIIGMLRPGASPIRRYRYLIGGPVAIVIGILLLTGLISG
ncbi:hypothetical protein ACFLXN_02890 [Chloroflexota bacterium]